MRPRDQRQMIVTVLLAAAACVAFAPARCRRRSGQAEGTAHDSLFPPIVAFTAAGSGQGGEGMRVGAEPSETMNGATLAEPVISWIR